MTTHARRERTAHRRPKNSPVALYGAFAIGALTVVAAAIGIGALARGGGGTGAPSEIVIPAARSADVAQNGHVLGDPNARVTIDEYVDFQCPFCMMAALSVMPTIEQQYVATGVAKIVVHPMAFLGDESVQAASAAEAANAQGKFWAYYDALYANQGRENSGAFSNERLTEMAQLLQLDMAEFKAAFESGMYVAQVDQTTEAAFAAGVNSTPTILVNGVHVDAKVGDISAAIEAAAGS
jgi:protein-disulfide isomerase